MFEKLENCTASTQHLQGWWLVGSTNSGTKHRKVVLCKKNLVTVGFEPTHLAIEDLKTAALDQLGQMTMESPGKNEYMFRRPPNDRPIVLAYHLLQLSAHLACPYSRHPLQNHPLPCTAVFLGQRRKERKQSS
ncbi:hypothetical protein PGTUg99_013963 [Puccinia graminis f. sp. tritici]|uniref:Uncharacterized protein n=1 Tax=Puccinia graminis f. sp. tritici TaxID=56615 RepID=A0A5B0QG26_PUCGR|nr:hypothetical protein PGTUg99_013963 [Puccinia graminis f. sp. tritici]